MNKRKTIKGIRYREDNENLYVYKVLIEVDIISDDLGQRIKIKDNELNTAYYINLKQLDPYIKLEVAEKKDHPQEKSNE